MNKYTIKQFNEQYPTEDTCLDAIFRNSYGDMKACPNCGVVDAKFYKLKDRKAYSCTHCRYQIHPLAGTIFHKSETPLKSWFFAIYLFGTSKNGVSAKELERHLGVTYKTAWRIAKQIRSLMQQDSSKLGGIVEMDETYMGGKRRGQKRGRGTGDKVPVFGMVERGGSVKAVTTTDLSHSTVRPIIREAVALETVVNTDYFHLYKGMIPNMGYKHNKVNHSKGEYVKGTAHTNTIEGFWGDYTLKASQKS